MDVLSICIYFLFVNVVHVYATNINILRFGMSLRTRTYLTIHGYSFRECKEQCRLRPVCQSVDYTRRTLLCSLNQHTDADAYILVSSPGEVHVVLKGLYEETFCGSGNCDWLEVCNNTTSTCFYNECFRAYVQPTHPCTEYGNMRTVESKGIIDCSENADVNEPYRLRALYITCRENGFWTWD